MKVGPTFFSATTNKIKKMYLFFKNYIKMVKTLVLFV